MRREHCRSLEGMSFGDFLLAFRVTIIAISGTTRHDAASALSVAASNLDTFGRVFTQMLNILMSVKQTGRNEHAEV